MAEYAGRMFFCCSCLLIFISEGSPHWPRWQASKVESVFYVVDDVLKIMMMMMMMIDDDDDDDDDD